MAAYAALLLPPNCQISRSGAWPWTRMMGRKVASSNQRALSSYHSAWSAAVGEAAANRAGTAKPPPSTVQYGMPEIEKPRPAGICLAIAVQVEVMSPDQ